MSFGDNSTSQTLKRMCEPEGQVTKWQLIKLEEIYVKTQTTALKNFNLLLNLNWSIILYTQTSLKNNEVEKSRTSITFNFNV